MNIKNKILQNAINLFKITISIIWFELLIDKALAYIPQYTLYSQYGNIIDNVQWFHLLGQLLYMDNLKFC